jgi:hypothetical protein
MEFSWNSMEKFMNSRNDFRQGGLVSAVHGVQTGGGTLKQTWFRFVSMSERQAKKD